MAWAEVVTSAGADKPLVIVDADAKPVEHLTGSKAPRRIAVLDSSFNPPTVAHERLLQLAEKAEQDAGTPLDLKVLLLGKANADKAQFGATLEERLAMMAILAKEQEKRRGTAPTLVGLTTFALFVDKAKAMRELLDIDPEDPSSSLAFIVGSDTTIRIFNPKYYKDPQAELQEFFGMARLISFDRDEASIKATQEILKQPLAQQFSDRITLLQLDDPRLQEVSSSEVRKHLEEGSPLSHLLSPSITAYIKAKPHMYQADAAVAEAEAPKQTR